MRAAKQRLEVKISKNHGNSGRKMFNQYIKNPFTIIYNYCFDHM